MVITTPRLTLRVARLDDFKATYQLLSDPEVMRFSLNGPYSHQKTTDLIKHCIECKENKKPNLMAVIETSTGQLIGYCGFCPQTINGVDEMELGYRFFKSSWGKGLATEAAMAMKKYGLKDIGLTRIISIIDKENIASLRVAEKIGLSFEKELLYDKKSHMLIYATSP